MDRQFLLSYHIWEGRGCDFKKYLGHFANKIIEKMYQKKRKKKIPNEN